MSSKIKKAGRPPRPGGPRELCTVKVPERMATRAAVIARLTGRTIDEVFEVVAGSHIDAEFARVVKAEE